MRLSTLAGFMARSCVAVPGKGWWLCQQDLPLPTNQGEAKHCFARWWLCVRVCARACVLSLRPPPGAASDLATCSCVLQAVLNEKKLLEFLEEKIKTLGTAGLCRVHDVCCMACLACAVRACVYVCFSLPLTKPGFLLSTPSLPPIPSRRCDWRPVCGDEPQDSQGRVYALSRQPPHHVQFSTTALRRGKGKRGGCSFCCRCFLFGFRETRLSVIMIWCVPFGRIEFFQSWIV